MTNKEILQKAIFKAEKNGFNNPYNSDIFSDWSYEYAKKTIVVQWSVECLDGNGKLVICNNNPYPDEYREVNIEAIIFDHNFAKYFFGEKLVYVEDDEGNELVHLEYGEYLRQLMLAWKYHLSKMVLEKHPLKYLERFLKD